MGCECGCPKARYTVLEYCTHFSESKIGTFLCCSYLCIWDTIYIGPCGYDGQVLLGTRALQTPVRIHLLFSLVSQELLVEQG